MTMKIYFEPGLKPIVKHGTHDQKTHGNWATGGTVVTSLVDKLSETKTPGFTIDIRTKTSPKDGYIASDNGAERRLDWAKVSATRDTLRGEIKKYIVDHAELLDGSGSFFGAWVEEGTLYLDVSRRYASRSEGVRAGFRNEQKAIYDVVNDSYIYMKDEVDDRAEKARDGRDTETSQGDDRGGTGRLRGRDSRGDTGQYLNRHVCLGRYTVVQKHLEGQHDQRTHGNWAGDRYPEDSVKSARDGALEYSFKKGLKHDETIDYKKVVANRERASQIADVYEDLPKFDNDAVDEYEALASEVEEQFDFMTKTLGVKVEFVADDPYKTSKEMFEDVSKGSLKVLQTETTGAHPLFSDEQNNKFRAVHDFFGHAATGRGFGQDGEEAAWVHHSQMFTEKARGALTTETRGQNSFFNNRGKQFADQKVALLPEQYWKVPATFSKRFEIYFEPGLKPTIKHLEGQHDQMKHGRWATAGYTAEESERISAMEGVGPSLQDMANALSGGEDVSADELLTLVMNDRNLYEQMKDEMDVEYKVQLEEGQFKYRNGREPNEQEKVSIYEKVENEAAEGFVEYNRADLNRQFNIENGTFSEVSELEESFRGVFDITKETDFGTIKSRIADVYQEDENTIKVDGNISVTVDGSSQFIGQFERVFMKNDDGTFSVEHKWLSIDDEYQGQGFGGQFIRQSEDYYTAIGIKDIYVTAGLEDGARHWARAGYDWDESMVGDAFRKLAFRVENNDSIAFTEQDKSEFDALWGRGATSVEYKPDYPRGIQMKDIKSPDFPFPAEFASLGWDRRTVGDNGDWDWAGKRLMAGLVLDYRKPITAEGRNLLAGPIDRDGDGLVYDGTARERPVSNN